MKSKSALFLKRTTFTAMSLIVLCGLSACACNPAEEEAELEKELQEEKENAGTKEDKESGKAEEAGDDKGGMAAKKPTTAAPAAGSSAPSAPAVGRKSYESLYDRQHRLAAGEVQSDTGLTVTVLRMALAEGSARGRYGKREKGIQLKMGGLIRNNTGKTLSNGALMGALVLRFGDETVKVKLSPSGFKPALSPEKPWRDGTVRLFNVETMVFPKLMMEYEPDSAEARVYAVFQDPVDFKIEAPIWKAPINWNASRIAPVKGSAQVFKAESLRAGVKGKAAGKLETGERVELLYQSRDFFRVKGKQGEGWVNSKALLVQDLPTIYGSAKPRGGAKTAEDEMVSIEIGAIENKEELSPEDADGQVKLKEGERIMLVNVKLTNKGEKAVKCTDFFADFGPKSAPGVHKISSKLKSAMPCEKGKLEAGQSAEGKVAFLRKRHEIPLTIGYMSPSKQVLLVDVYSKEQSAPYRK